MAADAVVFTVERCAECDGGIRIVSTCGDVSAVRSAARRRLYLAEQVTNLVDIDPSKHGHRVSCSAWKPKDT